MDTTLLKDLAISDNGFVFDPYSGHTFTVNMTGLVVLKELIAGTAPSDLATVLANRFDCGERDDPSREVIEFLNMLKDAGLIR